MRRRANELTLGGTLRWRHAGTLHLVLAEFDDTSVAGILPTAGIERLLGWFTAWPLAAFGRGSCGRRIVWGNRWLLSGLGATNCEGELGYR